MKKKLLFYIKASALIIALISGKAFAQTAIEVYYPLATVVGTATTANLTPTITGTGLTASDQSFGNFKDHTYSLASGQAYKAAVGTTPEVLAYSVGGGWQRSQSTTYLAGTAYSLPFVTGPLPDYTQYMEFKITADNLKLLKINGFKMSALGGGTGSARLVVLYSTDNFATAGLPMPVSGTYVVAASPYAATTFAATQAAPVVLLNTSTPLTTINTDNGASIGREVLTFSFPSTPISVTAGTSFSVRVYPFLSGSSSSARYFISQKVYINGTSEDAAVLPLDFLSLSGKADGLGKTVDLNWSTTNEVNTKSFEVQRKTAGSDFASIGSLASKNTAGVHHYSFTDQNAANGTAYYRILQSDHDGASKLSNVIAVNNKAVSALSVYPNPAEQTLNINHASAVAGANFKVLSLEGKTIFQKSVTINSTSSSLDVSKLATGTYLLILDNNSEKSSMKFIKK